MQAVGLIRLQDKNGNVISTYIEHGHLYTISKDFDRDKQVRKSAKESKQPSQNKIKTDFPRSESLASNSSKNLRGLNLELVSHCTAVFSAVSYTYIDTASTHSNTEIPLLCIRMI